MAASEITQIQTNLSELAPDFPQRENASAMHVRKRNGALEPVDVNKIVRAVQRCSYGLTHVDAIRVASKTIGGLYDGATTRELDSISIQTAAALIAEEPQYSRLAARLLLATIVKEVAGQNIYSFSQSIAHGIREGVVCNADGRVRRHLRAQAQPRHRRPFSDRFEYFGLRTVYDRYLLRDPITRLVTETPQHFFLRVACGLAEHAQEAIEFYRLIASQDYMPSSPTLFNAGTKHRQMSSCYLHDCPQDSLECIYDTYKTSPCSRSSPAASASPFIASASEGSLIRATNGSRNGIVPWLRTLDSSVAAVNQGGKRKGACCVYLEPWHADIESFLELRENTGDLARRTYNLNLANWIPDLFMRRVEEDGLWSLFDPKDVPHLPDLYGDDFTQAYEKAEADELYHRQIKARDLYAAHDALARRNRQRLDDLQRRLQPQMQSDRQARQRRPSLQSLHGDHRGHLAGRDRRLQSRLHQPRAPHHSMKRDPPSTSTSSPRTVRIAVPMLDRVIDINYYPIAAGRKLERQLASRRPRPHGPAGCLLPAPSALRLAEAQSLSTRIQEEIYYHALSPPAIWPKARPARSLRRDTRSRKANFQFDLWNMTPSDTERWDAPRASASQRTAYATRC